MYETKYAGAKGRLVGRRENGLGGWGEEDGLDEEIDVDLVMVRPVSQSSSVHGRRDSGVLGVLAGRDSPILGWEGAGAGSNAAGLPVDDDRDDRDQSAYFASPRTQEPRPPSFTSFLSIESDTTRRDSRSSYREPRPPSSAMVSDEAQGAAFSNHPPILKSSQRESNPARGGSRDSDLHPALLPDSYPSHLWTPALSQASTSSTRSSAFTSHYRSSRGSRHLDIEVVDDMPTHDESGLVAPAPEQPAFSEPSLLKQRSFSQSKIDPTSRPSLYSRSGETSMRGAANQRSHATSWVLDDRGDPGLTTDEDTDHDDDFDHEGDSFGSILIEQAQTKAAVIADEGRGAIINAEGMPVSRIPALHETTHLLLSSSSTPNSIPSFLLTNLPNLSTTLLALDISANFLLSLPASLTTLTVLEELNVSSNPLRVLPTFLSSLHRSLRILIADSVGLASLPIEMTCMKRLNVISLRRNKLHSVPDCVAGMDSLEELKLDGNIFLGPWKALVDPLLTNYQPLTPQMAISGTSSNISISDDETPATLEEEHTIRAPVQSSISASPRILTAPVNGGFGDHSGLAPLGRNRTLPTHYPVPRSPTPDARPPGQTRSQYHDNTPVAPDPPPAMRRMKSANELRDHRKTAPARPGTGRSITQSGENKATIPLSRSSSHRYGGEESPTGDIGSKYATLSLGKGLHRQPTTPNLFESSSAYSSGSGSRPGTADSSRRVEMVHKELKVDSNKAKWGFLKKMSMGRLKSPGSASSQSLKPRERPSTSHFISAPTVPRLGDVPEIITSQSAGNSRAVSPMNPSPSPLSTSETGEVIADVSQLSSTAGQGTSRSLRRRSFLPIDSQPSTLALPSLATPTVPEVSPAEEESGYEGEINSEMQENERLSRAKRTLFAYLQDMLDLNPMAVHSNLSNLASSTASPSDQWSPEGARSRRPTLSENNPGRLASESSFTTNSSGTGTPPTPVNSGGSFSVKDTESGTSSARTSMFTSDSGDHQMEERKVKDDKAKRARVVREIVETERTYVQGLQGLMEIYIKPASVAVSTIGSSNKETVVPPAERKIVFNGLDALYHFHQEIFQPALEVAAAPLLKATSLAEADADGQLSTRTARAVANVFLSHAAFMRMYSTYINNFDTAVQRLRMWTLKPTGVPGSAGQGAATSSSTTTMASLAASLSGVASAQPTDAVISSNNIQLSSTQRKRLKAYLKRCRLHPRHTQLNLEGYLLLPVQRVPRYRLMFEELVRCTIPPSDGREDVIEKALTEISSLAVNMNEGKRDAESRNKLVLWQTRIRGKFPSPLVQPHRRFIMDGRLQLIRVVRRNSVGFEMLNTEGDATEIFVDCLTPEDTERSLVGILCNDLMVLCKTPSPGQPPTNQVDLWAVLRMQTLATPASVVHGSTLRVVDNKAILYFEAPSTSDALTWSRAINLHIPASKS